MSCSGPLIDGRCSDEAFVTLQDAYNNSTNPQLTLSANPGALTIRDSATPLVGNLLQIQNNTGSTTYFSVNSTSTTVNGKLNVTGLIDPTGLVLDTQATVPGGNPLAGKGTLWITTDATPVLTLTDHTGTSQSFSSSASILTTKGDLLGRSAVGPVRVPVGADGLFLKADSLSSTGVSYATPASTLQATYNGSANGFITLDSVRGLFGIKDNAVPLVGNLFEVDNNTGATKYFSVSATGIQVYPTTNQITLGTGNTITVNANIPVAPRTYTLIDTGANSNFVMTDANQTINGNKSLTGLTTVATFIQTPVNVINVPPNPLVANTLYHAVMTLSATWNLPTVPADGTLLQIVDSNNNFATFPQTLQAGGPDVIRGADATGVNTYTMNNNSGWYQLMYQSNSSSWTIRSNKNWSTSLLASNNTWTGTNQFNNTLTLAKASNQLVIQPGAAGNTITLTATNPVASRIYTVIDTGANSNFVMTDAAQTINGVKTFSSAVTHTAASNQIIIQPNGAGNLINITAANPVASRTYTVIDSGANSSFIMTDSPQTLTDIITFSALVNSTSTTTGAVVVSRGGLGVFGTSHFGGVLTTLSDVHVGAGFFLPNTVSGVTPVAMTDYVKSGDFNISFNGPCNSSVVHVSLTLIANVVTMSWGGLSSAGNSTATTVTCAAASFPTWAYPTNTFKKAAMAGMNYTFAGPTVVQNNLGTFQINNDGSATIYPINSLGFPACTGVFSIDNGAVTWSTATTS